MFLQLAADDGGHSDDDEGQEDLAVDALEEDAGGAVGDKQRPAEVGLGHTAQHQAQQDGHGRQVQLAQHPGQGAEHQGHRHVKVVLVDGVGSGKAEDHDDGGEDFLGNGDHLGKQSGEELALDEHEDVDQNEAQHNGVHNVAVGGEQGQSGVQAVDHQGGEHDGHGAVTGNAQGEQGDEGGAGDGVVGRLGGSNALHRALSKLLGVLGEVLGGVIAEPGGLGGAGAGDDAHHHADEGGHKHRADHPLEFLAGDLAVVMHLGGIQAQLAQLLFCLGQDLHQGEQTDEAHGQVQA